METSQTEQPITSKKRTARQAKDDERWNALSTLVALDGIKKGFHESPVDYSKKKGSLVVIGSGIKCVGQFSLEAISHLKNADKVLYCVADPATEHFIRELCPDALDLYVLYANGKNRYETYVQMSEATLYYARKGMRTVMVFYGHPGIFVMPSHRCIKIAKEQGIEAYMLPAVSALDCLVADLGIDPSYPGMITLEATDLLLRKRTLLTDMHVILWQVGCVGDLGFTRTGYMNQHLPVLIEHLQGIYGNDYVITHYVGAQYPMCSPIIVQLPLSKILEPVTSKTITGISTFYIPPQTPKVVSPVNAQRLGLTAKPGKPPLVRAYANCGPQEKKAIHNMLHWTVPEDYVHYTPTNAGKYLGKLAQDVSLLHEHHKAPVKIMRAAGLSSKEISTILKKSPGHIRMLMKVKPYAIAVEVDIRIINDPQFASSFYAEMKKCQNDPNGEQEMNNWLILQGYDTTYDDLQDSWWALQETSLYPWTGVYTTNIDSVKIVIQGQPPPSLGKVWVNNTQIVKFKFFKQTLSWSDTDGNPSSASFQFWDEFRFYGKYWTPGESEPSNQNFSGQGTGFKPSLSNWVGNYDNTSLNSQVGPPLVIANSQSGVYTVTIGGTNISSYTFGASNVLSWTDANNDSNGELTFSVNDPGTTNARRKFSGWYWPKGTSKPTNANYGGDIDVANFSPYIGMYRSFVKDSTGSSQYGPECFLSQEGSKVTFTIGVGAQPIKLPTCNNSTISWSTNDGNDTNGSVSFFIDSTKQQPGFNGKTWMGDTAPTSGNFFGNFDSTYLSEWTGVYTNYAYDGNSWSPTSQITVNSATTPDDVQVTYGAEGTQIKSPIFNNPVLTWSKADGNPTNAAITFYYPKDSLNTIRPIPAVYGKMWQNDSMPKTNNFQGGIDTEFLQSWSGSYTTYFLDSKGVYSIPAPPLQIIGGLTESTSIVTLNGVNLVNFQYSTEGSSKYGYLKWSDSDNPTGGNITLFLNNSLKSSFSGYYWNKGDTQPDNQNWYGTTQPPTPGSYKFWSLQNLANNLMMAVLIHETMETMKGLWRALKSGIENKIERWEGIVDGMVEDTDAQEAVTQAINPSQEIIEFDGPPPPDPPMNNVENNVENAVENTVENNVENDVENNVENDVENNVENSVENNVENSVENSVENNVEVDTTEDVDIDTDVDVVVDICNIL